MTTARIGRRPKPTALKIASGNPGKRPLNKAEPKPPKAKRRPPVDLSPRAREHWNRLFPVLERIGVVSATDTATLSRYCHALATWEECAAFVRQNGTTYPIKSKKAVVIYRRGKKVKTYPVIGYGQFPQVSQSLMLSKHLLALECEFGMTPAARSKIGSPTAPAPKADDDADDTGAGAAEDADFFQQRDTLPFKEPAAG